MFPKKRKVRLPKVRRRAGESVSEERERRVYDKLPAIVFLPFTFWCVFLVTKLQQSNAILRQPLFWLIFAIILTILSAISFMRLFHVARRLNRGERGELHVADVLEELRSEGYKPVHDIVGNGFNIDHAIVGPGGGIFAIRNEVSQRRRGEITFRNTEGGVRRVDSKRKTALNRRVEALPAIRDLSIHESCGRRVWVMAIVVFVGDWKIELQQVDRERENVTALTHVRERLLDRLCMRIESTQDSHGARSSAIASGLERMRQQHDAAT